MGWWDDDLYEYNSMMLYADDLDTNVSGEDFMKISIESLLWWFGVSMSRFSNQSSSGLWFCQL